MELKTVLFGDDELLCVLQHRNCPSQCSCLLLAIKCKEVSYMRIARDIQSYFLYVELSNSRISSFKKIVKTLPNNIILRIPENCLEHICEVLTPRNILLLDLEFNCVNEIIQNCFASLWLLQTLVLNDNNIMSVGSGCFYNLSNLRFLNLSNNPLLNLPERVFKKLFKLKLFYFLNVSLIDIQIKALHDSSVKLIITNDYHLCCISSTETLCLAHKPWYISCSDILPEDKMKVLYMSVSNLAILLNVMSMISHYLTNKSNNVYVVIVILVNINEILCGIYLACIWISDICFKEKFLVKEQLWRSSILCFSAFGLLLRFTILTQLTLIFLSLSRLTVVIYPIDTKFKRTEFVIKTVLVLCMFSLLIAISTPFYFKFTDYVLPISLCLLFIDPTNSILLIKIITWFVGITQTASSLIIMVFHILLVQNLKKLKKLLRKSESNTDSDTSLIVQLIVITSSNIICWFPANGIHIAAMFLSNYPLI